MLLQILSQGSDPLAIQPYYETIFDSIDMVVHDAKDKFIVREFLSRFKGSIEQIAFTKEVHCKGNIEDWLMSMLRTQCSTLGEGKRSRGEEGILCVVLSRHVMNPVLCAVCGVQCAVRSGTMYANTGVVARFSPLPQVR